MVQSGEPLKLWGLAATGEPVTVRMAGVVVAQTLGQGKGNPWKMQLTAQKPGPFPDMEVPASNTLRLTDLIAGEVWLSGGGPNMVMTLQKGPWCCFGGVLNADEEVARATAFGDEWGQAFTEHQKAMNLWRKEVYNAEAAGQPAPPKPDSPLSPEQVLLVRDSRPFLEACQLFERRIRSLIPLSVKGVLWYPGETEARPSEFYAPNVQRLINGWRQERGRALPFGLVTLAGAEPWPPFRGSFALIREARIEADQKIPGGGLISATGLGLKFYTIYPPNKQAVGERSALWALAHVYGRKSVADGPRFGEIGGVAVRAWKLPGVHRLHRRGIARVAFPDGRWPVQPAAR
jgi:hypothetical protein